jgi:hypothetical protein
MSYCPFWIRVLSARLKRYCQKILRCQEDPNRPSSLSDASLEHLILYSKRYCKKQLDGVKKIWIDASIHLPVSCFDLLRAPHCQNRLQDTQSSISLQQNLFYILVPLSASPYSREKVSTATAASATAFTMNFARTLTAKAEDVYDTIVFKSDQLYNEPAPEFFVAFIIGGVFSALGFVLWVRRLQRIRADIVGPLTGSLPLRTMLSALIDNDEPFYTIIKMAAQSFLFLGGLQLNYEAAFSAMLGYFALESCFDSLRVILAFRDATDTNDCIVTSRSLRTQLNNKTMVMQPTNVYEDIGRDTTIVAMVFITQCLLIAFVVSVSTPSTVFFFSGCRLSGHSHVTSHFRCLTGFRYF